MTRRRRSYRGLPMVEVGLLITGLLLLWMGGILIRTLEHPLVASIIVTEGQK